jgi:hypothetical protein
MENEQQAPEQQEGVAAPEGLGPSYPPGGPHGQPPHGQPVVDPQIAALQKQVADLEAQNTQLTSYVGMIYVALGVPNNAQPADVLNKAKAATAALAQGAQQQQPPPGQAPQGFVSLPVAAGLALGALVAGGLGGWVGHAKIGGPKENPLALTEAGPKMEQGYALKFAQGTWHECIVGESVVRAAKFVGNKPVQGETMAMFRTPTGKVYAQTSSEPAPVRRLPARRRRAAPREEEAYEEEEQEEGAA